MNGKGKLQRMTLKVSNSGLGARMFGPGRKKIIFCNLLALKEFCRGEADEVGFTIAELNSSEQTTFEDLGEDER